MSHKKTHARRLVLEQLEQMLLLSPSAGRNPELLRPGAELGLQPATDATSTAPSAIR